MIGRNEISRYCCEDPALIENYAEAIADTAQIWDCHHRAEILPCGIFSAEDLKRHGLYWNRPASELVFIKHSEHLRLHKLKHSVSEETRRKISETLRGKPKSEETRRKMSEAKRRLYSS